MSLAERAGDAATSFAIALTFSIGGGIVWIIRRVLTNQAQIELMNNDNAAKIEMLRQSLAYRDQRMDEMRDDVRALRQLMDAKK